MFNKIRRRMFPLHLSRALDIVSSLSGSKQTRRWYHTPVTQLIDEVGDVPVRQVTRKQLVEWHRQIHLKNYSAWTIDSYTRAQKAFWSKLVALGHLDDSPAAKLKLRKLPRKKPKDIKEDDIRLMVRHSKHSPRDHAIVLLLADSAVRVGGLVSMTVSRTVVGEKGGKALVNEKGNKTRYIFFGPRTGNAIAWYIEGRPWNAPDELWLGRGIKPLTVSGVYQALRRIARRAGVKRFNPHSFRHYRAKQLISNGMPPKVVQELMGHSQISTTLDLYVNYTDEELQDFHARYQLDI